MTRLVPALLSLPGCLALGAPHDVSGDYEAEFADNLRLFIGDQLVADVRSGEDAAVEWDGAVFHVSQVCGDEGVDCPAETFWHTVGVEQPWGPSQGLLNFVNLDPERGELGARLGGTMDDTGAFTMLSGFDPAQSGACGSLGVGTVLGTFVDEGVEAGVIAYEWSGGCRFGGVDIGAEVRLETDYTAARTGPLDLSAVDSEPVTASGDPTAP